MSDEKDFTTFDEVWAELNRDPEFVKADHRLRPYFEVAKDLRDLRQELGLSQQELADRAKTHQSRISKLETADLEFQLRTLIAVAEALGSHVDIHVVKNWFITDEELLAYKVVRPLSSRTVSSQPASDVEASIHITRIPMRAIQP